MATNFSPEAPTQRLGAILLEAGLITAGQLNEALARKTAQGGLLGKILVELGYIRQDDLISFLVKQCKIPHISLMDYQISPELFSLVPKDICMRHWLLPIDRMGSILTVAMVDPLDMEALDQVRAACPTLRIKPILCSWQHYENVIRKFFPGEIEKPKESQEVSLADLGFSAPAAAPRKKAPSVETVAEKLPQPVFEDGTPSAVSGFPSAELFDTMIQEHVSASIDSALDRIADAFADELARQGENAGTASGRIELLLRRTLDIATEGMAESLLSKVQQALCDRQTAVANMTAGQLGDIVRRAIRRAVSDSVEAIAHQAAIPTSGRNAAQP